MDSRGPGHYLWRALIVFGVWWCLVAVVGSEFLARMRETGAASPIEAISGLAGEHRAEFLVALAMSVVLWALVFYYLALYARAKKNPTGG